MVNFLDLKGFESFFNKYVANASSYGEFGCGASTHFILSRHAGQKKVYSVENDGAWVDNVLQSAAAQEAKKNGHLNMFSIDTGPVGDWGYPKTTEMRKHWPLYSRALNDFQLNVCVVDGRFRVACALNVMLHQSEDCIIIFDDFWNRPHYHIVLQYCDVLDRFERVAVLRRRKSFDEKQAQKDLDVFQYVPN